MDASHRVTVVNDNNVYQVNSTKIKSITRKAISDHQDSGSVDVGRNQYAYRVAKNSVGQTIVVFLNETLIYNRFWLLFRVAVVLEIGSLIVFAVVFPISKNSFFTVCTSIFESLRLEGLYPLSTVTV